MGYLKIFSRESEERWRGSRSPMDEERNAPLGNEFPRPKLQIAARCEEKRERVAVKWGVRVKADCQQGYIVQVSSDEGVGSSDENLPRGRGPLVGSLKKLPALVGSSDEFVGSSDESKAAGREGPVRSLKKLPTRIGSSDKVSEVRTGTKTTPKR